MTVPPREVTYLSHDLADGVLRLTLNRPERLNALRRADHREVTETLRTVAQQDEVRAVVLHGAGRAFCVGGDDTLVEETTTDPAALLDTLADARGLVQAQVELEKPVVCAIHGQTSGAGAALALLSDIVVAERSTRLCDGHVPVGMVAGDGGVLAWPLAMGLVRAKRFLLTGDYIEPDEAERLGLVTEVVPDGSGLDRAMEWALRLATLPPAALRLTKRALNGWLRSNLASFEAGLAYEMLTLAQPEVADAFNAARERARSRRAP